MKLGPAWTRQQRRALIRAFLLRRGRGTDRPGPLTARASNRRDRKARELARRGDYSLA